MGLIPDCFVNTLLFRWALDRPISEHLDFSRPRQLQQGLGSEEEVKSILDDWNVKFM